MKWILVSRYVDEKQVDLKQEFYRVLNATLVGKKVIPVVFPGETMSERLIHKDKHFKVSQVHTALLLSLTLSKAVVCFFHRPIDGAVTTSSEADASPSQWPSLTGSGSRSEEALTQSRLRHRRRAGRTVFVICNCSGHFRRKLGQRAILLIQSCRPSSLCSGVRKCVLSNEYWSARTEEKTEKRRMRQEVNRLIAEASGEGVLQIITLFLEHPNTG